SQFDREHLAKSLQDTDLQYVYLGRELGGRPRGEAFYDSKGHVYYDRVASSAVFGEGIARLEKGIDEYRVAILCAEEDPTGCHRRLLVGRVLSERGISVDHIRGDGSLVKDSEIPDLRNSPQMALFHELDAAEWKSIPSVSLKRRQSSS